MNTVSTLPGMQALWNETLGDAKICVAILDGPVNLNHPCFEGADITQVDTIAQSPAGDDSASKHGTHIASIIFGQHGSSVQGIAPSCRGLIVPIYSSINGGSRSCSQLDLVRAIHQAVEHGANIINISGGELSASGIADPLLEKTIAQCVDSGILIVAAAGNDGCRCLHVPASMSTVLAVGAIDATGQPLNFSNWGDMYHHNSLMALGEKVLGAEQGGGTIARSGTSFSAPIISGVAALLLSLQRKRGIDPCTQAVQLALRKSADTCELDNESDCRRVLTGRLNIAHAHTQIETGVTVALTPSNSNNMVHQVIPASFYMTEDIRSNQIPSTENQLSIPITLPNLKQRRNIMTDNAQIEITPSEVESLDSPATELRDCPVKEVRPTLETAIPIMKTATPTSPQIKASEIVASDCGCGGTKAAPTTAYTLGQIGFDFGTEANRDSFLQLSNTNVHDPLTLLNYLQENPSSATNVTWTLSLDATVIYAIQPYGPFASNTYDRLREFLRAQTTEGMERVSVPGVISGSTTLMYGQEVPLLYPDLRGMYGWSTKDLISACAGICPEDKKGELSHAKKLDGIQNFLERIYYEVRNLGAIPQERAMNYAATNAFQVSDVYANAIEADMKLDTIDVERSPICRPGSDCWDVKLCFFNPEKRLEKARHVYRFTIDVSEVIPVTVGKVRHWDLY